MEESLIFILKMALALLLYLFIMVGQCVYREEHLG